MVQKGIDCQQVEREKNEQFPCYQKSFEQKRLQQAKKMNISLGHTAGR
jgi:hypothetical protein